MPTYVYACTNPDCGHQFEAVQAFTDDALTVCPACGQRLRKVFGSVGVVFKGSGFYRNDSREKVSNGSAKGGTAAEKSGGTSESTGSGSSESSGTTTAKSESGSTAPSSGKSDGSTTSSSPTKAGTNGSTSSNGGSSKAKQSS